MKFSFFRKPKTNVKPYRDITLLDLYKVIKGNYYQAVTENLRTLSEKDYKAQKSKALDYITPGGTFATREVKSLIAPSGFVSIDIDNITNPEEVKAQLTTYENVQLIFTSPSGKGVKAIFKDSGTCDSYLEEFENIAAKLKSYEIKVDKGTSDISRACFLCYDSLVWINPQYLNVPAPANYYEILKDGRTILMSPKGYPASWDIHKSVVNDFDRVQVQTRPQKRIKHYQKIGLTNSGAV